MFFGPRALHSGFGGVWCGLLPEIWGDRLY